VDTRGQGRDERGTTPFLEDTSVRRTLSAILLGVGMVVVVGCGGTDGGGSAPGSGGSGGVKPADRINGSGATFIEPMMKHWSGAFKKAKDIEIDYNGTGSGAGVAQMTAKETDFGCSDAPMNDEQINKAKANGGDVIHVPLVMGGVVPAYNLPEVDKPIRFTGPVLAKIFLGEIKKWNDPALVEINQGTTLPDFPISVAHRSDASGTSHIFTDYLSKVSPEWKEKVGASTSPKWPTGAGAPKNPGVAGLISGSKGTIGYVELIYALDKKDLKFGPVKNKAGEFVLASLESVTAAAANLKDVPDDLRFSLTDADGKDSYPISGTSYAVAYVKHPKDKAAALKMFLTWATHEGQEMNKDKFYAKIPKDIVDRADKKIALIAGE
jgi:phosphate transport system substrate-binding protein